MLQNKLHAFCGPFFRTFKDVTGLSLRIKEYYAVQLVLQQCCKTSYAFFLPVFPYIKHIVRVFIENDNWYLEFECDWLLNKIHLARDRAAVVTDRAVFF